MLIFQAEVSRRRDAEINKLRKDIDLANVQFESQEATLRKRYTDTVNELSEQVDYLGRNKNK